MASRRQEMRRGRARWTAADNDDIDLGCHCLTASLDFVKTFTSGKASLNLRLCWPTRNGPERESGPEYPGHFSGIWSGLLERDAAVHVGVNVALEVGLAGLS